MVHVYICSISHGQYNSRRNIIILWAGWYIHIGTTLDFMMYIKSFNYIDIIIYAKNLGNLVGGFEGVKE